MPVKSRDRSTRDLSMKDRIRSIGPDLVDAILEELSIPGKYKPVYVILTMTYLLTNSTLNEAKESLGIPDVKYKNQDIISKIEAILIEVQKKGGNAWQKESEEGKR